MSDTGRLLAQAQTLHRAGHLRQAEQLYRQILQSSAAAAEAHYLHGMAYQGLGMAGDAAASMQRAIAIDPEYADAHYQLGAILAGRGQLDDAIACFLRVLRSNDQHLAAAFELGNALLKQSRLDQASYYFRELLKLQPDHPGALTNLASALRAQGQGDEALACCRRAATLNPDSAEVQNNLGVLLMDADRAAEALDCYARALALRPNYPDAHANWATALLMQNRPAEALAQCELALRDDAGHVAARQNASFALLSQGKLDEALASAARAVQLNPHHAESHFNYGVLLLLAGRFAEGWPEYEWRLKKPGRRPSPLEGQRWTGEALVGRTILLQSEQGHGDTLQFVRYAQMVKDRGATVVVQCERPVAQLLKRCPGVDHVVTGEARPPFDVYVPLLNLPGILGTSAETIPAPVPYLVADDESIERWRQELGDDDSFKIGIAWCGNAANPLDRRRSIPLAQFAPLARVPGVRLYSLQFGAGVEDLTTLPDDMPVVDFGDRLGDFYETGALVRNLDLVITCDSAPCHLAGALGVTVWVALPFAPDWRWLLEREDTPWYPTMRLFRQSRPGDWPSVFRRMANALARIV